MAIQSTLIMKDYVLKQRETKKRLAEGHTYISGETARST